MQRPDIVEVETGSQPVGSVIWLHGLGADGHDFEPIVAELRVAQTLELRFVFPHAPVRPVTVNAGVEMRAWYDIVSLDKEGRADEAGIRDSSRLLDSLIEAEQARGFDLCQIVVAGFSQGGAIAIHNVLTSARRLAGLMALSTYVPLPKTIETEHVGDVSLPVFMAHGTVDPMVPYQAGRDSALMLEQLGYTVAWHEYAMAHAVCPQEIDDISDWLQSVFDFRP